MKSVRQTLSLPPDMLKTLKAEATRRDLTVSQIVREKIRLAKPKGLMFGFLKPPEPSPDNADARRADADAQATPGDLPGSLCNVPAVEGKAGSKSWVGGRRVSVRLET